MSNNDLIQKFYTSFTNGDVKGMTSCYHKNIVFQDPVFGRLEKERAIKMWEMLLSRRTKTTTISFDKIQATVDIGTAHWKAEYLYGEKGRKVINLVSAEFKFKDGLIIEHTDTFNLWKWTQQAIGLAGYLVGWTPFMKAKIQKTTKEQLDEYINAHK